MLLLQSIHIVHTSLYIPELYIRNNTDKNLEITWVHAGHGRTVETKKIVSPNEKISYESSIPGGLLKTISVKFLADEPSEISDTLVIKEKFGAFSISRTDNKLISTPITN